MTMNSNDIFLELSRSCFHNLLVIWIAQFFTSFLFFRIVSFFMGQAVRKYNITLGVDYDLELSWWRNNLICQIDESFQKGQKKVLPKESFGFLFFLHRFSLFSKATCLLIQVAVIFFCLQVGTGKEEAALITLPLENHPYLIDLLWGIGVVFPFGFSLIVKTNLEEAISLFFQKLEKGIPIDLENKFFGIYVKTASTYLAQKER